MTRRATTATDAKETAPPHDGPLPVALEDSGRIAESIACRRCGYALRGLPIEGACPECSTPVGRSIHGDLLRYSAPDWVERIARGAHVLVLAVLLGIASTIGILVVAAVLESFFGIDDDVVEAPRRGGLLLVCAVQIWGYWLVTSRDPALQEREGPWSARSLARYALIFSTLIAAGTLLNDPVAVIASSMGARGLPSLATLLRAGIVAIGLAGMAALFVYARSIALRIPDESLARNVRRLMWLYLLSHLLGSTESILAPIVRGSAGRLPFGQRDWLTSTRSLAALPILIAAIWSISLLTQYRERLREAARQARATWAKPI